jgi:hypothetical protein
MSAAGRARQLFVAAAAAAARRGRGRRRMQGGRRRRTPRPRRMRSAGAVLLTARVLHVQPAALSRVMSHHDASPLHVYKCQRPPAAPTPEGYGSCPRAPALPWQAAAGADVRGGRPALGGGAAGGRTRGPADGGRGGRGAQHGGGERGWAGERARTACLVWRHGRRRALRRWAEALDAAVCSDCGLYSVEPTQ